MAVEKEKKLYAYQEKFHLKVKVWTSMIELLIVFHMKMYFQGTHPFVIPILMEAWFDDNIWGQKWSPFLVE